MELEQPCTNCSGSGLVENHGWDDWYKRAKDCPICNGCGKIPTELGEQILTLLKHNLHRVHHD